MTPAGKPTTPPSLKARALRLLAMREHSRAELERKLLPHQTTDGELAQVLDGLQAKGFINEQRVLDSVLHRRAAGQGSRRIRQELQHKGLAPEAVAGAMAELAATEPQRAQALWAKRFGSVATDPAERARQVRFLAARGFGSEAIRRAVRGLDDD